MPTIWSATGTNPEDHVGIGAAPTCTRGVKADLGLRALAEAEHLEVDDDEFDAEIVTMADRMEHHPPETLRRQLDTNGRTGAGTLRAAQRARP